MELLKAVSMGSDILPSRSKVEEGGGDGKGGELSYVRAPFEHVMGSKENSGSSGDGGNKVERNLF